MPCNMGEVYARTMRWLIHNERNIRIIYAGITGALGRSGWHPWLVVLGYYRWCIYAVARMVPPNTKSIIQKVHVIGFWFA